MVLQLARAGFELLSAAGGAAPPTLPRAAVLKLTGLPVAGATPSMEASDALWVHADTAYAYYAARRARMATEPAADEESGREDLVDVQQRAELDASLCKSLAESRLGAVTKVGRRANHGLATHSNLRYLFCKGDSMKWHCNRIGWQVVEREPGLRPHLERLVDP
eukprot:SAG31_NODE_9671_length_1243_cov_1.538462_1_plen_163_part_10